MNGNEDLSTPSVPDFPSLRNVQATSRGNGAMIYVLDTGAGQGAPFFLNKSSVAADDNATVIAPNPNLGEGRWLIGGGGGGDSVPTELTVGLVTTNSTIVARDMGSVELDLSLYSGATVTFRAIVQATAGVTVEVSLYDVTNGLVVASSVLTSTSLTPDVVEADVTADLDPATAVYTARVRISDPLAPVITDVALCLGASLVIEV